METSVPQTGRMDLGDLLDVAGKLYVQNAALFLGTIGVVAVVQVVLRLAAGVGPGGSLSGILGIVAQGALIQAIAARHLGRPMSIGEAFSSIGFGAFIYLIVAMILYGIAVAIGLILIIIPGIYLLVRWLFVPQAIILERTGIFQAFTRSSQLVSGSWWRVFGYGLVLFVLVTAVIAAADQLVGVGSILAFIIEVAVQPFSVAVLTLLYFDLRARHGESALTSPTTAY